MDEDLKDTYLARIREALDAPTGDDELFITGVISRRQIIADLNSYLEDVEQETGVEHERIVEMTRGECREYAKQVGQLEFEAINQNWTEDAFAEAEAEMKWNFLTEIMLVTIHDTQQEGQDALRANEVAEADDIE